jgi:hypothetical protein
MVVVSGHGDQCAQRSVGTLVVTLIARVCCASRPRGPVGSRVQQQNNGALVPEHATAAARAAAAAADGARPPPRAPVAGPVLHRHDGRRGRTCQVLAELELAGLLRAAPWVHHGCDRHPAVHADVVGVSDVP